MRNQSSPSASVSPETKPKLLDQMRYVLRKKHYKLRTEYSYISWVKRFLFFHNMRHPSDMGAPEIETFLTHLAVDHQVAASTQNPGPECPDLFVQTRAQAGGRED